jgi:hypothetical protein
MTLTTLGRNLTRGGAHTRRAMRVTLAVWCAFSDGGCEYGGDLIQVRPGVD